MRNSLVASSLLGLVTSLAFIGCGGEDGGTATTTDQDTGAVAVEDTSTSTTDTGTSTTDTAVDDTGTTTTEAGADSMTADTKLTADTKMTDGPAGDTPVTAATFTAVYAIITANCAPCHTMKPVSGNLDLTTKANAYNDLVGKKAGGLACAPGGMIRVVAGSPDTSLLIHKLTKPDADVCGGPMPKGRAALPASEITTIRNWITAGAKND